MHLDQLGHARRGTQRADPDQASKAITVGSLRRASCRLLCYHPPHDMRLPFVRPARGHSGPRSWRARP
jgi:hypothetical protein